MRLRDLMEGVCFHLAGDETALDLDVSAVVYDSRKAVPGSVFVCVKGSRVDGHDFAQDAVARGAVACVAERPVALGGGGDGGRAKTAESVETSVETAVLLVGDSRKALARMAFNFYGNPSARMTLVGVVGTNGKTTTAHLIKAILEAAGHRVGLMGTVGNAIGDRLFPAVNTTPESLDIQAFLDEALRQGARHTVMEVSSHAIALERIAGVEFDVGVFTNITHDHLDFHGTFQNYLEAKSKFFADLGCGEWRAGKAGPKLAIVNADDPNAPYVAARSRSPVVAYAVEDGRGGASSRLPGEVARLIARGLRLGPRSTSFEVIPENLGLSLESLGTLACGTPVHLQLVGRFNVSNALAAVGAGLACGVDLATAARGAGRLRGVPGRFETVDEGQGFGVVVDYAHTPDGLDKVLRAARSICEGRLVVVFGCGGDRDRRKRPEMGEVAATHADIVVVTSDNPRSEDPQAIIDEVRPGVERVLGSRRGAYHEIADRRAAIRCALGLAGPGDVVVIAGKGHETYQILRDGVVAFDDRSVAREVLRELGFGQAREARPAGPGGVQPEGPP